MSRSMLHDWEHLINRICGDKANEMLEIAQDIYNTAYVRGGNAKDLLEPRPKWIPVSERLPEVNQKVLVSTRDLEVDIMCDCCYRSDYFEYPNVLAWQPLPEPYKESVLENPFNDNRLGG